MPVSLVVAGDSHPGLAHPRNEDSLSIVPLPDGSVFLVVCDGMGGMGRGDQASRLAIVRIADTFATSDGDVRARMAAAVSEADRAIRAELNTAGRGHAGCTVVMAYVKEGQAHIGWVGDSRVYVLRDGAVVARTKDHKLVQELVDMGQLTPEEAKRSSLASVITRAVGGRPPGGVGVAPAFLEPLALQPGDRLVLCSDGLADLVPDDELARLVIGDSAPVVQSLIQLACDRGGHDNISVIVAECGPADLPSDIVAQQAGAVVNTPAPTPLPAPIHKRTTPPLRARPAPMNPMLLMIPPVIGLTSWALLHFLR